MNLWVEFMSKKKTRKKDDRPWWQKYQFLMLGFLPIAAGVAYVVPCLCEAGTLYPKDGMIYVRVGLLVVGAGLVFINLHYSSLRAHRAEQQIEKTEQQIDKAQQQIEEAKEGNFITALNSGANMLTSHAVALPRMGVQYLHNLAKAHKDNKERVQQVFEILCLGVRRRDAAKRIDESRRDQAVSDYLSINQAILHIITNREDIKWPSEADLHEAHLKGADLGGTDLAKANLDGADLGEANLKEANLSGANLKGTNLSGAILATADLQHACLEKATLYNADLTGADLREADLKGADMRAADLRGAKLGKAGLGATSAEDSPPEKTDFSYTIVDAKLFNNLSQLGVGVGDTIWAVGRGRFKWHEKDMQKDALIQELEGLGSDEANCAIEHLKRR